MNTFAHKILAKRRALTKQATHTDNKGRLYKFCNGHLWILRESCIWGLRHTYPVYSKATERVVLKPLNKETSNHA